ncbi:MAG: transglutaminase family protein [Rhizobiaceae bacterium]|nr:transglutaminase family protein [Rhizobiaceae bacterium]
MLYEVLLNTKCVYDRMAAGRQVLRLMPADEAGIQRLVAGAIDIHPAPSERTDRIDFFGNRTVDICFDTPNEEIEVILRARVDRFGYPPAMDVSARLRDLPAELAAVRTLDAASPHHFAESSPLIGPSPEIASYVRDVAPGDASAMEIVSAINLALHRDMQYDGDATTVDTPLEEAFAKRRGVCQDFAHIMIACLREIGIPAGYVSGFLRTEPPKGMPRLEGADAMHAWVQAWCGANAGWIEFDPTNAMMAGLDHIVAARGRDYSDVAPVRGVLRTSGAQEISQSVDVIPLS